MAIRAADSSEAASLNANLGAVQGSSKFAPSQDNLLENTYRTFFSENYLPTLIANPGTWYLIESNDQSFLRKAAALLDSPRPIAPGYFIQCRTQESKAMEVQRRKGNLWVRVVAI
jgi:hypothetical protein